MIADKTIIRHKLLVDNEIKLYAFEMTYLYTHMGFTTPGLLNSTQCI